MGKEMLPKPLTHAELLQRIALLPPEQRSLALARFRLLYPGIPVLQRKT